MLSLREQATCALNPQVVQQRPPEAMPIMPISRFGTHSTGFKRVISIYAILNLAFLQ